MTIGADIFMSIVFVLCLGVAANFRLAASISGSYLIGRRRFHLGLEHRRERLMRAYATIGSTVLLPTLVGALAGNAAPAWTGAVSSAIGLIVPVALWFLTRGVHGPEIDDDAPSKTLFG